ncbi:MULTISPECIES: hypothetical protein [unclassified Nocardioides]|jgi:hypothetical protein|uniref:hypothetical protein n=1 Tax=unclassified Nocardioides TaxID=2615069 RepID=UPI000A7C1CA5|nr:MULTISPECIES: hypothetical protein [unclassified Nocardioides]
MSVMRAHERSPQPRVREQAREVLLLMSFSAAVSVGCALLLVLPHLLAGSTGR